jgi:hypothetical protein
MTDQLRLGSRHFQLDLHWVNNHLRLCHGMSDNLGCSPFDRLYAYGIKEIGTWLDANPGEIMTIDFEDYAQGHDNYVNDPLATYLGSKILTPAEWPAYNMRLPTKREMLAAGKQVIVINSSGILDVHGGAWIFPVTLYFGQPSAGGVLDSGAPNLDFRPEDRHCYYGIHTNPPGLDVFDTGHQQAGPDAAHLA